MLLTMVLFPDKFVLKRSNVSTFCGNKNEMLKENYLERETAFL